MHYPRLATGLGAGVCHHGRHISRNCLYNSSICCRCKRDGPFLVPQSTKRSTWPMNITEMLIAPWIPADPLSTRGWIVQERALSQQKRYFWMGVCGDPGWVIDRSDQCKCSFYNLCLIKPGKVDLSVPHLLKSEDSLFLFLRYWRRLLEMYTATELTKPSDKLVAINRIVSKIRKSAGLRFIAGLWEELLSAELLWTFVYPGEMPLANSVQEYRAPTWSWACLDEPVADR